MIMDTSFEEDVVQHIEGALTNLNRKVVQFPYQVSGRIGLRFWGKVIIQEEQFVDDIFPPNQNSLFDAGISEKLADGKLIPKRKKRRQRIYKKWKEWSDWKRPEEVYGRDQFCVFARVEASDVTQGGLGNCYFLAALSALAENPHRIKNMFHTKTVTESGAYAVKLFVNGEPMDIVVDDHFPFDTRPEKDCWFFSRDTSENEIWVQILEKAYAKVFGSYEVIEGGKAYQAFANLTGFPSDILYHDEIEADSLWRMIQKGARRDQPMVSAVNSIELGQTKMIKKKGLADHHAYTVLTALTVVDEDEEVIRLVKIRNPYGTNFKREWQLDWQDASDQLKEYLTEQLGINEQLDGVFWMRFENFQKFFYCTTICLYQENYQQICLSDTHGKNEHALTKLIVHDDIESTFIIKLHQIHRRFLDGWLEGNFQYAPMQLYLARVDRVGIDTPDDQFEENTETVRLIDGHRGVECPVIYLKRNKLPAGEYLLFYRVAFRHEPEPMKVQVVGQFGTPVSAISSKVPLESASSQPMEDATDMGYNGDTPTICHENRKIVVSLHFPTNSKIQMQRIETEPSYGKEVFTRMRHHYKKKFEEGLADEDVVAL